MRELISGLVEGAVPLIAGIVITYKLRKNKNNKLFYLGPILLVFGILLVIKSFVGAETNEPPQWVGQEIVRKLKEERNFPVDIDFLTTLDDIKATSNNEITYFHTILLDDFSNIDKTPIINDACKSKDLALLHEKNFDVVFIYNNTAKKEVERIRLTKNLCKK